MDNILTRDDEMSLAFPRGVLGFFILVWGLLSSHLAISIALCTLVEGIKLQRLRWDLSAKHFQNIADFTTVLFAVVAIYQFVQYGFHGIYGILSLLPLCLFPLIFAQRISSAESFPMSALFLSLRRKITRGITKEQWVSTEFIYALSCLLGASTEVMSNDVYFFSVLACSALLLFLLRSPTTPLRTWFLAVIVVAGISLLVRVSMEQAYREVESTMSYWFSQLKWNATDPSRTRTSIGHIGKLKLSDRIVLRVKAPLSIALPLYLREASYTKFNLGSWHAPEQESIVIDRVQQTMYYPLNALPLSDETPAQARPAGKVPERIEITAKHPKDVSVQAFPIGSVGVESAEIIELKKNSLGTVSLEAIPGQLRYHVDYLLGGTAAIDNNKALPATIDLDIPSGYRGVLEIIEQELGLSGLSPSAAIARTQAYFMDNFRYSLIGKSYYPGKKALHSFLTDQRSGHCEYFATATTLLLRSAGIPARYSVGYVVEEYSALEKAFIARSRHAHAWAEAYVDGHWQIVDTTPSNWLALEEDRVSNWQSIQDYLGWFGLHISRLQRLDRTAFNKQIIWLVPALLMLLMWRLRRAITVKNTSRKKDNVAAVNVASASMAQLVENLMRQGVVPKPGQTILQLLTEHRPPSMPSHTLKRLITLYYQERFSKGSISEQARIELREAIQIYLNIVHDQALKKTN